MMKWLTSHYFIGMVMLAGLLFLHRTDMEWLEWMRHQTFDVYQQIEPRVPDLHAQAAPVRIIDIDEKALKAHGQWPWPRTELAALVDALREMGVAVIGLDIVFSEEDRASPHHMIKMRDDLPEAVIGALARLPDSEQLFAEAIARSRVVAGQVGVFKETPQHTLPRKVGYGILSADKDRLILPKLNQYRGLVGNLPVIEDAASGLGLFSTRAGYGGTVRKVALVERVKDQIYPSLSLEMLRVALGGEDDYLIRGYKDGTPGIQSIVVKGATPQMKFEIPTDPKGQVYVHFAQYPTAQRPLYISAADIMKPENAADKEALRQLLSGALVVIGTSAVGLKDIRKTPISPVLPGVEVHAQLLETILSNVHLTRPFEVIMIEWLLILFGGLMMIFLIPHLNSIWTFLLTSGVIASAVGAGWYHYTQHLQLLDVSYPALSLFGLFLLLGYLNYVREEQQRKQVKNAFSHYVSPALLEQLADNPETLALGGETRNISVLFSDIRGFTTISEQFNAQELTQFINQFLTPMTNVILEHQGTIDKYMGDAIMAFWNAPLPVEDHAHHACYAALKMQQAVKELNAILKVQAEEDGKPHIPIAIGVGVNTDDCCVGNMGSDQRFDYSALGDGVNLGSRLEGQSKTYGVDIIIGENTAERVKDEFALIELDLLQVKGKTEPVRIFALMGDASVKQEPYFQTMQATLEEMLAHYRGQRWKEAQAAAEAIKTRYEGLKPLCELFISRSVAFAQHPPPKGWKGVAIAETK